MTKTIQNLTKESVTFFFGKKSLTLRPLEFYIKDWNEEDWSSFFKTNEHHEGVLFSLSNKTSKAAKEKVADTANEKLDRNRAENRKKGEMSSGAIKVKTEFKKVEE